MSHHARPAKGTRPYGQSFISQRPTSGPPVKKVTPAWLRAWYALLIFIFAIMIIGMIASFSGGVQ